MSGSKYCLGSAFALALALWEFRSELCLSNLGILLMR
jgi:hypothetical protein